MGSIFKMGHDREIFIASQNCYAVPAFHISRIYERHSITYVSEGEWTLDISGELIKAKKDHVFIQPANVYYRGTEKCPPGTHSLFVHFYCDKEDEYVKQKPDEPGNEFLYIESLIDASDNREIKELMRKIIEEKALGNGFKASAYLSILLCELSQMSFSGGRNKRLADSIRLIAQSHTERKISNEEIAKSLNISVRTAEMVFKNAFGMSIQEYRRLEKIKRAKHLIKYHPEMKMIDISLSLGFYDEYHFSKCFKKVTEMSPTEYKKSCLKK